MTVVVVLIVFVVLTAVVLWPVLHAPAQARHRRAVVRRVWDRHGIDAAYAFARERRWWDVVGEMRPEVVANDPLRGAAVEVEYRALHARARAALKDAES